MQYNEIEMKLIRLALDKGAHDGESDNAAAKLIRQLRKRGITPEQMAGGSGSSHYEQLWRQALANSTYYQSRARNLESEVNRLKTELSRARQGPPQPRTQRPRAAAYGMQVLSLMQRTLLIKIAKRAEMHGGDLSRSLHKCCDTHPEYGTIQQLMKKGMVEKGNRRGFHKLTEKGIEYYKKYGK